MLNLFRSFWFKYYLSKFQWYRQWYGGIWEYHWIEVCGSCLWLDTQPDKCWPNYRQPGSFGTPTVENYVISGETK